MILVRLFIKNFKDVTDSVVRKAYGILASIVGILCNILLSASKIICGILFKNIAMLADGINNLSDAGSSIVTFFGFKIANSPADKEHPFGHKRAEYIATLIIAFIIVFISIQLISSSFNKIISKEPMVANYLSIIILSVSILVKIWMSLFNLKLSKAINSSTLKATSIDSRNDVFATTGVLISTIIGMTTKLNLDGYFGIVVGLMIFISGIKLSKETLSPLLGEPPSKELRDNIIKTLYSYEGTIGIHDLLIHNYGPLKHFASVHVEVDKDIDIMASHDAIDNLERQVQDEFGVKLVIHLDPVDLNNPKINEYKDIVSKVLLEIEPTLTMHDFRAVFGQTHNNLIFDVVTPSEFKMPDNKLKETIQEKIKNYDESCFTVVNVDKDYIEGAK